MFSDKTRNLYFIDKKEYKQILHETLTEKYRKADSSLLNTINNETLSIVKEIKLNGKVMKINNIPAFIILKDQKADFPNKVGCRLLNPMKSDLGKIAKKILDKMNSCIKTKTKLNQWKNNYEVVNWFDILVKKQTRTL